MPFVSEDNPNARFAVSVWLNDDAKEDYSFYTSLTEAKAAFERLEKSAKFLYGALYEWVGGEEPWRCLDAWPDNFDGF